MFLKKIRNNIMLSYVNKAIELLVMLKHQCLKRVGLLSIYLFICYILTTKLPL